MGIALIFEEGQTPLDEDEKEGLRIPTIINRGELDEFEQQNIEQAILWSMKRTYNAETILSEPFIKSLHRRMYGNVWTWAGKYRTTNKNIGVDKWQIGTELKALLDDTFFWHSNSVFQPDELVIRFKHRLESIHCFPNGNGRHSRLMADILFEQIFGKPVFTWGSANLNLQKNSRLEYLKALKSADSGDFGPLIAFARS